MPSVQYNDTYRYDAFLLEFASDFPTDLGFSFTTADEEEIPFVCQNSDTSPYNPISGRAFRHKPSTKSPFKYPAITFHPT